MSQHATLKIRPATASDNKWLEELMIKISREIKPTIGMIGDYHIPIRDEIDLEFIL